MKKGFTMIELIFVIVILGILAAVAIPRLAATRDDAEMSKAAANLSTVTKDLAGYYTSQGNFSDDSSKMTNVLLVDANGVATTDTTAPMYLQVKKALCFAIQLGEAEKEYDDNGRLTGTTFVNNTTKSTKGGYLTDSDAIGITAVAIGAGNKICAELFNLPAIKSTMTNSELTKNCAKNSTVPESFEGDEEGSCSKLYQVGGTGVVYDAFEG